MPTTAMCGATCTIFFRTLTPRRMHRTGSRFWKPWPSQPIGRLTSKAAQWGGVGCTLGKGMHAKSAQFGYWLGEAYWGRGIMTAAIQRVAPYVLRHFKLVRLQSPVFA